MVNFFINRPIVAMVISIIMVIIGLVSMAGLPVAQFPAITPPEVFVQTTYVGADAQTIDQSVATPIEQQMSGVDNMDYMYSINSSNGTTRLTVNFDVKTDPNTDLILTQSREALAEPQLPLDVRNLGVTVRKSLATPLMLMCLSSPDGTYDATFLANYAYINLVDELTRVRGIADVQVFGAGQYAMRFWVDPNLLAKLQITVPQIINAITVQNTVNPAGQIGGEPVPAGQEFTYTVRVQGRLTTPEEFGKIVVRANPDGSFVRLSQVARIELGAQVYNIKGRLDGKPAAIIAVYQLPGTNAVDAANGVRSAMDRLKLRFPPGLDYTVGLDTTAAVTEGVREIVITLFEALGLVVVVVFVFLQGWRATLIPLLAVPVSLIGTFALFPLFGFTINTLSLFGLVLAIGLVVDDAIVVVEAVERKIEHGLPPKEATRQAMAEVASPIVAIALILAAVFLPTVFLPGITGRLYQQFALTIAISVILSAFNALTLSPALAAILLKPKKLEESPDGGGPTENRKPPDRSPWALRIPRALRHPLSSFFRGFNRSFEWVTEGYVKLSGLLIRRAAISLLLLAAVVAATWWFNQRLPSGFMPDEDQGYLLVNVQLKDASSLQLTDAACKDIEKILADTPGIAHYTTVVGFSLLSTVNSTYNAFFFVNLKPWHERTRPEEQYAAISAHLNRELARLPKAISFAFSPPAIPGVGRSGGVTFILQDRSGGGGGGGDQGQPGTANSALAQNVPTFMAAASKRPELLNVSTTYLPATPQVFAHVDRDKALKLGVPLEDVYRTVQAFMGGFFVNFFNRFGRQWQVYVQAEGEFRTRAENIGQFYVRNNQGQMVPLSTLVTFQPISGPEFTMRFNEYSCAQINAAAAPGYSSAQAMAALEETFAQTMPPEMGYDYLGMSFQEKKAQKGVPAAAVYALSLLFVFLILAAQYESWSLPFSVLLSTPFAVMGAFGALLLRRWASPIFENNVYAQIGVVMLIGLAAKNAILIVQFAKMELERSDGPEESVDGRGSSVESRKGSENKGPDPDAKTQEDRGDSAIDPRHSTLDPSHRIADAALTGARIRLRPILMTSFAMILGLAPLVVASGAGAIARRILGTVILGGLLAATCIAVFLIPFTFYLVESLVARFARRK